MDDRTSAALVKEVLRAVLETDVVILSDYDKGVFTGDNAGKIIRECRLHEIPVVVDFKPANRMAFAGADIIAPNAAEAAELNGGFSLDSLESDCQRLHTSLDCRNTVVTLGEHGICGVGAGGFFHVPGHRVEPVDKVGCGDTVRAGLAIGAALGLPLLEAAELANDAATVIVQKPATSVLSRRELHDFVSRKIEGEPQSAAILAGHEGQQDR